MTNDFLTNCIFAMDLNLILIQSFAFSLSNIVTLVSLYTFPLPLIISLYPCLLTPNNQSYLLFLKLFFIFLQFIISLTYLLTDALYYRIQKLQHKNSRIILKNPFFKIKNLGSIQFN